MVVVNSVVVVGIMFVLVFVKCSVDIVVVLVVVKKFGESPLVVTK